MFVVSVKTGGKIGRILLCLGAALVLGLLALTVFGAWDGGASSGPGYQTNAATPQERIAFLEQFGWKVEEEPLEFSEVTIPKTFNAVYEGYNSIQLAQGLDLVPYAGKTCEQWVYEVLNHPSGEEGIRATLLVYEGKVIAGDICSPQFNGFITGFDGRGGWSQQDTLPESQVESETPESSGSAADDPAASEPAANDTSSEGAVTSGAEADGAVAENTAEGETSEAAQGSVQESLAEIPASAWPTD